MWRKKPCHYCWKIQGLIERRDLRVNSGHQVWVQSERKAIRDQLPLCCSFCFYTGDLLSVCLFVQCMQDKDQAFIYENTLLL